ncbi:MAG: hypothetical protein AAF567_14935 [Actinomycetota bacterium]
MTSWWGRRTPGQKLAIVVVGWASVFGVADVFGSAAPDRGATALTQLLVVASLIGVLAITFGATCAVGSRPAGKALRSAKVTADPSFTMPEQRGGLIARPDDVDVSGANTVYNLDEYGFERVGSFAIEMSGQRTTHSCMLSRDETIVAVVGPTSFTLYSEFDGKLLMTTNDLYRPLRPSWLLAQVSSQRHTADVRALHDDTVLLLMSRGLRPTRIASTDVVEWAIVVAQATNALGNSGAGTALIGALNPFREPEPMTGPPTLKMIAAWRSSPGLEPVG